MRENDGIFGKWVVPTKVTKNAVSIEFHRWKSEYVFTRYSHTGNWKLSEGLQRFHSGIVHATKATFTIAEQVSVERSGRYRGYPRGSPSNQSSTLEMTV